MVDNLHPYEHKVVRVDRENILKQKAVLIWFTGLSGSGKSTLASALQKKLVENRKLCYILDGDNIRKGLNCNLGFSPEDRSENIRRVSEVAKLFVDAGVITLVAFISPYIKDRDMARKLTQPFVEVYVKCDIAECKLRDPKGLYAKAAAGEIKNLTGIGAPYEEPRNPEVVVDTAKSSVDQCAQQIYNYLVSSKLV
jgi:adenylylsulfate kinase